MGLRLWGFLTATVEFLLTVGFLFLGKSMTSMGGTFFLVMTLVNLMTSLSGGLDCDCMLSTILLSPHFTTRVNTLLHLSD